MISFKLMVLASSLVLRKLSLPVYMANLVSEISVGTKMASMRNSVVISPSLMLPESPATASPNLPALALALAAFPLKRFVAGWLANLRLLSSLETTMSPSYMLSSRLKFSRINAPILPLIYARYVVIMLRIVRNKKATNALLRFSTAPECLLKTKGKQKNSMNRTVAVHAIMFAFGEHAVKMKMKTANIMRMSPSKSPMFTGKKLCRIMVTSS